MSSASSYKWTSRKDSHMLSEQAKSRLKLRLEEDSDFFDFVKTKIKKIFEAKGYYKVEKITSSCIYIKPDTCHLPDLISHFQYQRIKINHPKLISFKNQWGNIGHIKKDAKEQGGVWCSMDRKTSRHKGYGWFATWESIELIGYCLFKFISKYGLDIEYLQIVRNKNFEVEQFFEKLCKGNLSHIVLPKGLPVMAEKEDGSKIDGSLPYNWTITREGILQEVVRKGLSVEEIQAEEERIISAALERSKRMNAFFSPPKKPDLSELSIDVIDYSSGLNNQYGISYIDASADCQFIKLYPLIQEKNGIRFKAVWIEKQRLIPVISQTR